MALTKISIVMTIPILVVCLLTGCNNEQPTQPIDPWYQETVDAVAALQPKGPPEHLREHECIKTGNEWDINTYFTVLTNISVEEGYYLDYVYRYEGNEGYPVIFFKENGQEPYKTYSEWYKYWNKGRLVRDKIRINGTKEGFFEYVVLNCIGGQFYFWWHAYYRDKTIICDPAKFDEMNYHSSPPEILIEEAKSLNYEPVIEFREDKVIVIFMIFTEWEGVQRVTYTINREYPHTIDSKDKEVVLEYDSGLMF